MPGTSPDFVPTRNGTLQASLAVLVAVALLACGGDDGRADTSPRPVMLTVAVSGPGALELSGAVLGTCESSCELSVAQGAEITLSPSPAAGARFDGFGGACSGTEACTLRPAADTSVTATFSAEPVVLVELTIARTGDGTGAVTSEPPGVTCTSTGCSGRFEVGTLVTLTAVPDSACLFRGWEGGGCSGTGPCELTLSIATALSVRFERDHLPDRYRVTELAYGDEDVRVRALDEDGNAVGCVGGRLLGTLPRAFLYEAATGAWVLLPPEDRSACAIGLGGGTIAIESLGEGAYRFADGTLHELQSSGGGRVSVADVNDSGWIVGTATLPDGRAHPFVHDGVTMQDLYADEPDASAFAVAINARGEVLASDERLFSAGTWTPLSLPAGAFVTGLSDGGLVVGGVDVGWNVFEGFVHDVRTGVTTRVKPPEGRLRLTFHDVNGAGTRLLAASVNSRVDSRDFVYGAGEFQSLAELLGSPDPYTSGEDVNNRGQIAVVVAERDRVRSFILTPE